VSRDRPTGYTAGIIFDKRTELGMSKLQLAERAGISRSRIIAAEADESIPTMDVCLKLAVPLAIPRAVMVRALMKDLVRSSDPAAVAGLDADLGAGSVWENTAQRKGFRIGRGQFQGTVSDGGDFTIVRRLEECSSVRPLNCLTFRDRIAGHAPPSFAVTSSPKNVGYDVHQITKNGWRLNRVEFHRPWTPNDGPLTVEFETPLPEAFVLSHDEYKRRQGAEAHLLTEDWHGYWQFGIKSPFERLEVGLTFPTTYTPSWAPPTAAWVIAPLDDPEANMFDEPVCRSSEFTSRGNHAKLILERPLLGLHYTIHWHPLDAWTPPTSGASA